MELFSFSTFFLLIIIIVILILFILPFIIPSSRRRSIIAVYRDDKLSLQTYKRWITKIIQANNPTTYLSDKDIEERIVFVSSVDDLKNEFSSSDDDHNPIKPACVLYPVYLPSRRLMENIDDKVLREFKESGVPMYIMAFRTGNVDPLQTSTDMSVLEFNLDPEAVYVD